MGAKSSDQDERISRLLEYLAASPGDSKLSSIEQEGEELVIRLSEPLDQDRLETAVAAVSSESNANGGPNLELDTDKQPGADTQMYSLYLVEDLGGALHKQRVGPTLYPGRKISLGTANPVLRSGDPASENMAFTLAVLREYLH